MAQEQINPLSDARYREINTGLGMIIRTRELMDKAEKCGVDVSEDRAYFDAMELNFNNWKGEFFPTKP